MLLNKQWLLRFASNSECTSTGTSEPALSFSCWIKKCERAETNSNRTELAGVCGYPSLQVCLERTSWYVHLDAHALREPVWGFLDTIPDSIKVGRSPPASSSDYLTAGSGLRWLIPRQSLRLVQRTEKECVQRPDDENKNTCWGSRPPPKNKRHVLLRPSDGGYNAAECVRVVTLRLNVTSPQTWLNRPWIGSESSAHFPAWTASSIQPQAWRAVALARHAKPKMRSVLPAFPAPAGGEPSKGCLICGNKPVSHPVGWNNNRRPLKASRAETLMCKSGPHDPSDSFVHPLLVTHGCDSCIWKESTLARRWLK